MPLAHACSCCGLDLTRLLAAPDPVYQLPLVVCPGCRTAAVRRSDGHRPLPREVTRLLRAFRSILCSTLTLAAAVGAAILSAFMVSDPARDARLTSYQLLATILRLRPRTNSYDDGINQQGTVSLIVSLMLAAWCGGYLTTALPHLKRRTLILFFTVLTPAALFTPALIEQLITFYDSSSPNRGAVKLRLHFAPQLRIFYALPITALASLVGFPIGLRVRRSLVVFRANQWRRLRARTRKRRQG